MPALHRQAKPELMREIRRARSVVSKAVEAYRIALPGERATRWVALRDARTALLQLQNKARKEAK